MQEKSIRKIFVVGVILKGMNSVLEILGGILFLWSGAVSSIISFLITKELIEDPSDFLASHLQRLVPYFTAHSQLYAAFYLLSHGIVKIFLVVGLLRNKLWAYPTSIVFLCLFIVYQVYRFAFTHSLFLFLLTLFDIALIALTWHEYKFVKKHMSTKA